MKPLVNENTETPQRERALSLSPAELQSLYLLKEKHVDELICAAVDLDEGQRRFALNYGKAMVPHRPSKLS